MTREQANNYLRSSGFSDEQIETIARAYENSSYNSVKTELDCISRQAVLEGLASIAKAKAKSDAQKSLMGRVMFFTEQLPSVSTEKPCKDVISRAEVLDLCESKDPDYKVIHFKEDVECLPPASTEKTGYWIDDEFGSKCSCCGIYTHLDKFDRPMKFKHCSMCGARMEEVEE